MTYFNSWDANVFLCLLSVFPEEVVRGMIKMVKKKHEDYVQGESLEYWLSLPDPEGTIVRVGKANRAWWKKKKNLRELSDLWRWRCPEKRRKFVVRWTYEGQWSLQPPFTTPYVNMGEATSKAGYWNSDEAWSYSVNEKETYEESDEELTLEYDNDNTWERYRRLYVSQWYENIHEGRYFLFFKENDLISDWHKYRDNQNPYVKCVSDIGERWQVAQDLLTIDGPGLGESPGSKIEHIDDLFS